MPIDGSVTAQQIPIHMEARKQVMFNSIKLILLGGGRGGSGSNYLNGNGTSVAYHHVKTITASDGTTSDYLSAGQDRAQALEMSKNGEYIIAGTYRADPNSLTDAGKTYIFKNT